jgi:hypothetical protein
MVTYARAIGTKFRRRKNGAESSGEKLGGLRKKKKKMSACEPFVAPLPCQRMISIISKGLNVLAAICEAIIGGTCVITCSLTMLSATTTSATIASVGSMKNGKRNNLGSGN